MFRTKGALSSIYSFVIVDMQVNPQRVIDLNGDQEMIIENYLKT